MIKNKSVAIVGGGILGLVLAYRLSKNNVKVTLIEQEDKLGGLAAGFKIEDEWLERYYHHFFKSDKYLNSLLKELGLIDDLHYYKSKVGVFSNNKIYNFSTVFDVLKFGAIGFIDRVRLGVVTFFLQKVTNFRQFKNVNCLDWSRKYFGNAVTNVIWEPLLKGKFGKYFDKISMTFLWARIHDRASCRPSPIDFEYLGYLDGSLQKLIDSLEVKCSLHGVNFLKSSTVKSYTHKEKHQLVIVSAEKIKKLSCDYVVGALPAPVFEKIFKTKGEVNQTLKSVNYIGAICATLVLKESFMPYYWLSVADESLPFMALIEHTNLISSSKYNDKKILYISKYIDVNEKFYRCSDQEILEEFKKGLLKINPEFDLSLVEKEFVIKGNFAQNIVGMDYKIPTYETDKPGLYFANFAQIYPHDRGVNYAVLQAEFLAKKILQNT